MPEQDAAGRGPDPAQGGVARGGEGWDAAFKEGLRRSVFNFPLPGTDGQAGEVTVIVADRARWEGSRYARDGSFAALDHDGLIVAARFVT